MSETKKQHTLFPKIEQEIRSYWDKNEIFEKSLESQTNKTLDKDYVFYDGPPFANGLPHYGHLLTGFVKDIVARYQTMLGSKVERRFGWDCHGLPAEMGAEKELGVQGRLAIKEYGIGKFNDYCKTSVLRYTQQWEDYVSKQARWVDFKNNYKTMQTDYMESVLWAFKELYKKGLLYEDIRVMPYSWKCQTPLSNFEIRIDNSYRKKESKSVYIKFPLKEIPEFIKNKFDNVKKAFFVAWTTTPWTLPANLGLAVKKDVDYRAVNKEGIVYIMAENLADTILEKIK